MEGRQVESCANSANSDDLVKMDWNFLITMVLRVGGGANLPRTHLFLN